MKNTRKIIITLLTIILVFVSVVKVDTKAADILEANDAESFLQAVIKAKDGDTIKVTGFILWDLGACNLGSDSVHVTVTMSETAALQICDNSSCEFRNVTFLGGNPDNPIIRTDCNTARFKECTFKGAKKSAVEVWGHGAWFDKCTFEDNAGDRGGHIAIYGDGSYSINTCTFTDGHTIYNDYASMGGAISSQNMDAVVMMVDDTFTGNSSAFLGGAIYSRSKLTLKGCKFSNNTAPEGKGQDICNESGTVTIKDTQEELQKLNGDRKHTASWIDDATGNTVTIPTEDNELQFWRLVSVADPSSGGEGSEGGQPEGGQNGSESSSGDEGGQSNPDPQKNDSEGQSASGGSTTTNTDSHNTTTSTDSHNTSNTDSHSTNTTDSHNSQSDDHSTHTDDHSSTVNEGDHSTHTDDHRTSSEDRSSRSDSHDNTTTYYTTTNTTTEPLQGGQNHFQLVKGASYQATPTEAETATQEEAGQASDTIRLDVQGANVKVVPNSTGGNDIIISDAAESPQSPVQVLDVVQVILLALIAVLLLKKSK